MIIGLSRKRVILIAVAGILAISVSALITFQTMAGTNYDTKYSQTPRAAVIDQLYDDYQNPAFEKTVEGYLQHGGYAVDLYTTKNITVGFYKALPQMGYKIIVIRSHASLSYTNDTKTASADLFTGEKYAPDKYTVEQMLGLVDQSSYIFLDYSVSHTGNGGFSLHKLESSSGRYFSVGSKFVDQQMEGRFPGSIVIIGGCASLSNSVLAESLIKRGATVVIGWNNLVMADHNDRVILEVLDNLLVEKYSVHDAVDSAMQSYGPDQVFSSVLRYYPASAGDVRAGAN